MKAKNKIYDIKLLPLDIGRLVCFSFPLIFRLKRITPTGEKYREKIKGGAIIAANHTSFSDPLVVAVTFWFRRVFFLVGEIVFKGKIRSLLLKGVGGIKIDRNNFDIEAIKKSVEVLKNGHLLSIFPQGGINKENNVNDIKSGAVLIAMKAGVPIIPIHITEREKWWKRKRIIIGNAVYPNSICNKKFPSTTDINNITEILSKELKNCILEEEKEWEHSNV